MKIAIVNEVTTANRNGDIVAALEGRDHEIINLGMDGTPGESELDYLDIGVITGMALNLGIVDFVVGGCGTSQGYGIAAMQFPGVYCGNIRTPLDAWLFAQINGGNCVSLMLNQQYGYASDVNLKLVFDSFFSVELAGGYPEHRKEPQKVARERLAKISIIAHKSYEEIIRSLPEGMYDRIINTPQLKKYL